MLRIGINCGHTVSGAGGGAVGFLNESAEARQVGYHLMEQLKRHGYQVIDCTNDIASSVSSNLSQIVALANAQSLDAFYSIHFNAGGGKGSEIYTANGKDALSSGRILAELSALGFQNRGVKDGNHLFVVRRTVSPAALIEVCFVDQRSDANLYQRLGAKQVAAAICRGITGELSMEKEALTMTQYEDLQRQIQSLAQELQTLKTPTIYNFIDQNMPDWARASVQKLVDRGVLRGTDSGLGLTETDLRHIVWNDRAGLYD